MKVLLKGNLIDLGDNLEAMRNAIIEHEANALMDIGCDGLEADEMAHDAIDYLPEEEILNKIKLLEVKND